MDNPSSDDENDVQCYNSLQKYPCERSNAQGELFICPYDLCCRKVKKSKWFPHLRQHQKSYDGKYRSCQYNQCHNVQEPLYEYHSYICPDRKVKNYQDQYDDPCRQKRQEQQCFEQCKDPCRQKCEPCDDPCRQKCEPCDDPCQKGSWWWQQECDWIEYEQTCWKQQQETCQEQQEYCQQKQKPCQQEKQTWRKR